MIALPQRSVTRFFIPLIDVLTLLFCIYLLMPIVKPAGEDEEGGGPAKSANPLSTAERQELDKLRNEKKAGELDKLKKDRLAILEELAKLRKEKLEALQQRMAIRVLEIGEEGKLYYYDPQRSRERRVEITEGNVAELIRSQKETTGNHELYFLILYPRVASGNPPYPLRSQREEYDRWLEGVAHGYDIPIHMR